jgi:hypothetical protein
VTDEPAAKYRLFAALWAVCLLFDLAGRGPASTPAAALVTASAAAVLLRPGSTALLAAAGALTVANVLTRPGFVFVHWYFDALVGAALALAWLERAVRGRTFRIGEAEMLAAFAPAGRALVLMAIGFAGFAKLNTMFLDPADSCAVALYLAQSSAPGFSAVLPDATWARVGAIGLTLLAELGVPVMVLIPALRPVGFVVAAAFFFLLGINPIGHLYEFAGPMLALLVLFAADTVPARVAARLQVPPALRYVAAGALVVLVLVAGRIVWWVGVPALLGLYLGHLPPLAERLRTPFRGGALLAWIPALLMLANEGIVYLGFSHNMTFTMASDLRAMGGRTNHVLVTPPVLPGNRPVEILQTNDPFLRLVRKEDARIQWLGVRYRLHRAPDARVTFRVEGEEPETVARAGDDPRFAEPPFLGPLLFYTEQPMERRCGHWEHPRVKR